METFSKKCKHFHLQQKQTFGHTLDCTEFQGRRSWVYLMCINTQAHIITQQPELKKAERVQVEVQLKPNQVTKHKANMQINTFSQSVSHELIGTVRLKKNLGLCREYVLNFKKLQLVSFLLHEPQPLKVSKLKLQK